jgi:membrane protein DedA with SNARE-associated domain
MLTMTELLLSLVPQYGLFVVAITIFLAALGVPLPSSVIMLTCGGFAATGDLNLFQLLLTALGAYLIGDQLAYAIGSKAGPMWLESLKSKPRLNSLLKRSERLLNQYGKLAILISRTLLSPVGPYIAYMSGASKMQHAQFSAVSAIGVGLWTIAYSSLGFLFTGHVPALSDVVESALVVSISLLMAVGFSFWLMVAWRRFE